MVLRSDNCRQVSSEVSEGGFGSFERTNASINPGIVENRDEVTTCVPLKILVADMLGVKLNAWYGQPN